MKKTPLFLMALNILVWGGLSWIGWGLIRSVEARHAAGYPNLGQIEYYLVLPLLMLSVSLVPGAFLGQTRWSSLATIWCSLTLIAVVPYLLPYSGGV
jgi:hypothetical protein